MAPPTRDRILDAALEAFATRGVDGTPITDLEQAAGLAAGSGGFYRYFRTKDEALAAVVHREIDRVLADGRRGPTAPSSGGAHAEVRASLDAALATLRSLSPLMAILAREQGRIPELAREISEQLLESGLRQDAARLAEALGVATPDHARALGAVVLSALVGYTLATDYFGTPPGGVDRSTFVTTIAGLLAPADDLASPDKERSL